MLFRITRIVFWLLLFVGLMVARPIFRVKNERRFRIVCFFISLALSSISSMFPVENLFINFSSPESVFSYTQIGEINQIVDGQESCLIVYTKENGAISHCIFPLTDKGYKIPTHFAVSRVSYFLNQNGAFTIYRLKDTDDYYSFCSINQSGDCDIQAYNVYGDALDVDVYRVESGFYYFYLHDFSSGSYLEANGERVLLSNG